MGTLSSDINESTFSSDNGTSASEMKDELKSRIGSRVQSMLDGASERLSGAKTRVRSAASTARTTAGEKVESMGDLMHRHPLATIAIGLGVGYLLGRFMAARR